MLHECEDEATHPNIQHPPLTVQRTNMQLPRHAAYEISKPGM